jgi:F-type H+-transporting ATPase subunit delta
VTRASRKLAKRYAQALMAVAKEDDRVIPLREELDRLGRLLQEQREFREFLVNPAFELQERVGVLQQVLAPLELSATSFNFLRLLLDKNRFASVLDIILSYRQLADEFEGRVWAQIISARPLTSAEEQAVSARIAGITGKEVSTEVSLDPSLVGGLVIKIGGLIMDGSISAQLAAVRETLARGA